MLSLTFSQSFLSKMYPTLKIIAIFSQFGIKGNCRALFVVFRNKARNVGRSRKNAGNKPTCGISRTIAGRLTPMVSWVAAPIIIASVASGVVVTSCIIKLMMVVTSW